MKLKLSLNPAADLRTAAIPVKAAYLTILAAGLLVLADAFTGSSALGVFHGGLGIALGVFVAYLASDTGLLILRGRSLGRTLGLLWGLAFAYDGAAAVLGGERTVGGSIALLVGAALLVELFLPATTAHFKAGKDRTSVAAQMLGDARSKRASARTPSTATPSKSTPEARTDLEALQSLLDDE